jgi:DNA repair protein RecO (recombination protein O)
MSERERIYRTHALILRRRDHSDADRILTIFTPGRGRVEVIAKGVRKPTSKKAGHVELFCHANMLIAQARTWDIVTEVVTVESFRRVRDDLDAISRAAYLCELLDAFSEGDDDARPLWDLALFVLRTLDEAATQPGQIDRSVLTQWFVLHLLSLTGFQPQIFHCIGCGEEMTAVTNFLSLSEGGVYCPNCAPSQQKVEAIEPEVLKVLRFLQSRAWNEVERLHVRKPVMRQAETILQRYLQLILERRLRSVDFLRRVQNDPRLGIDASFGVSNSQIETTPEIGEQSHAHP